MKKTRKKDQEIEEGHLYGGQAVIEGVMMKTDKKLAIAVRKPDGKILVKKDKLRQKKKWLTYPFIRGIANLFEIMIIGIKALFWSADQQLETHEKITTKELVFTLITTILFSLALFVGLPYILTIFAGFSEESRPILFNIVDGIIKLGIFFAYLLIISQMKDVKRVFEYHGAEHKAIYCKESGMPLTVNNAKLFSTKHPRCGTSFLVIVMGISVFVFTLIPTITGIIFPTFSNFSFFYKKIIMFSLRIFMVPLIAAISYEILKVSAKYKDNFLMKLLVLPGLFVQNITTKEPDDKQLEVAIKSLKTVL